MGTTNRTRLADYTKALARKHADVALVLKVHPSNYRVEGFVEHTPVEQLATLPVPVVADIGSGLVDATCPWLPGAPPAWLADEPAARQTLAAGAALVTFSGDKLLGGPQAGIIAGRAELVKACAAHPLARALRPGAHVLLALQQVALAYLDRTAADTIPFWRMAAASVNDLSVRASQLVADGGSRHRRRIGGAARRGLGPWRGDPLCRRRRRGRPPRRAAIRTHPDRRPHPRRRTLIDLRTIDPADDALVAAAIAALPT